MKKRLLTSVVLLLSLCLLVGMMACAENPEAPVDTSSDTTVDSVVGTDVTDDTKEATSDTRAETTAPVEGDETSAPVEGDETTAPVEGDETTAPVEGDETTAPVEGDETSAPVEGDETSAPVEGDETTTPVEGDETSAPVEGDETSAPVEGDETTAPVEDDETSAPVEDDETTAPVEGDETSAPEETEAETEAATEAVTEEPPVVFDFNAVNATQLKNLFNGANQTTVAIKEDEDGERYAELKTSVADASDPYVSFSASTFRIRAGVPTFDVAEYPYVLLKVRSAGCSSGSFVLYYWAGTASGPAQERSIMEGFDSSETGWQYILFDMTGANGWSGSINGFRFDYMMTAVAAGEALHIAEVQFLKSADSYYKSFDVEWDDIGIAVPDDAKQDAESLLDSAVNATTSYDSYQKENAANEDASLKLWFDHMYTRAPQSGFTPTDKISYLIQLAKNETEGCQFVLAPTTDVSGLKVFVTDFKNADGDTLKTDLHWGYYFDVKGQSIIDPLPPVTYDKNQTMLDWCNGGNAAGDNIPVFQKYDGFDIKGGESQSFVLKATTTKDSAPGEYSATVTVMSADGKEIKKATVYVYVWNFTLADESDCKTLMDMGGFDIYLSYYDWNAALKNDKNQDLYEAYYNFLLNYRVNCYTLPTENKNGSYGGSASYLNNPRVQAFLALGWKTELTESNVENAYNSLSQNPDWLDKAYFYPVDEPGSIEALDRINAYGEILKAKFPGYKLIAPMHINYATSEGDYFSYVAKSVNVWCPKTFFFNTFAEWFADRDLEYGTTPGLEEKLGSLRDRFWEEQKNGDEVWWYVTRFPNDPEITFIINTDAVNIRTVFWQTKLYGVDGFLYYSINHWSNSEGRYWVNPGSGVPFYHGLDAMHEINSNYPYEVYGNGILIYSGAYFAQTDPVASLRLESIRDGIEDYEYMSMLEKVYGTDVVNGIITEWTTGLGEYSTDVEAFRELRAKLGALVEAAVNAQ